MLPTTRATDLRVGASHWWLDGLAYHILRDAHNHHVKLYLYYASLAWRSTTSYSERQRWFLRLKKPETVELSTRSLTSVTEIVVG
jgi:hypothetical protein